MGTLDWCCGGRSRGSWGVVGGAGRELGERGGVWWDLMSTGSKKVLNSATERQKKKKKMLQIISVILAPLRANKFR